MQKEPAEPTSASITLPQPSSSGASAHGRHQLVLIPAPNGPHDPLNWPLWRKYVYLAIICFGAFAAATAPTAHQTAYLDIATTYHQTPNKLSYTISAAVAGLIVGPFLIVPCTKLIGRTAVVFWCLMGVIAAQIWAATATNRDDYISFAVSRAIAGLFASVPTIIGSGYIMDIFFLHQRGFAFTTYELSLLLGITASPTIGGFIAASHPWPVVFWWTLAPLGLSAVLVAAVIEDTDYAKISTAESGKATVDGFSYSRRRFNALLGVRATPPIDVVRSFTTPLVIGVAPATVLAGFYTLINFAWAILVNTELAIFLQTPVSEGGYGFSVLRTAAFTFISWFALAMGQLFGSLYNDRMPVWLASRGYGQQRGRWCPEYRLWSLIIGPAVLSPIGTGIVGAALQYHLHYMVLGLGLFLVAFSALLCVPVCVNYVVENYTNRAVEASVVMNAYRLALGLSVGFYFRSWQKSVGVGWVFGMASFFTVFAMCVLVLLACFGSRLRRMALQNDLVETEEGQKLTTG